MISKIKELNSIKMPSFEGARGDALYMYPIDLNNPILPIGLERWMSTLQEFLSLSPIKEGIAYVTIDQKFVKKGKTFRRGGAHIEGNYINGWGSPAGWLTGIPGRELSEHRHLALYNATTGGTLIATDYSSCGAWEGRVDGIAGQGGNCENLREQFEKLPYIKLKENTIYWMNSTGIHESLPLDKDVKRTMFRITLPANAPNL